MECLFYGNVTRALLGPKKLLQFLKNTRTFKKKNLVVHSRYSFQYIF